MWFSQRIDDFGLPSTADTLAFPKVDETKSFHKLGLTIGTLHHSQTDKKKLKKKITTLLPEPVQMKDKFVQRDDAVICLDRTFIEIYEQYSLIFPSISFHPFATPGDGKVSWFVTSKDGIQLLRPLQWKMLDSLLQQNSASLEEIAFAAGFVELVDLTRFNSEFSDPLQRSSRGALRVKKSPLESAVALVTGGQVGTLRTAQLKAAEELIAQRGWQLQTQLEGPD